MRFRLIYDGRLLGSSRTDTRAEHKHEIRRTLHQQLKRFWSVNGHLKDMVGRNPTDRNGRSLPGPLFLDAIGKQFEVGGYQCIPLVTGSLELSCGLDILFLRYDQPGATLIQSGDIDNRLKTLFDALRRPQNTAECFGSPTADEVPLFCLLEDDKFIDHVAVTTDLLLEPNKTTNDVHLIIDVKIKPSDLTIGNIGFL